MNTPLSAHVARSLRFLRNVRGWRGIATRLANHDAAFVVNDRGTRFAGNLQFPIDREAFLYGAYDRDKIDGFLAQASRRGTVADIGANIGNHALAFARHFDRVISFEPNPGVWPALEHNVDLNPWANISLRKVGLGDVAADLPIYVNGNHGMSTLLREELDDAHQAHVARIVVGDEQLKGVRVDAIKIDVQGYEPQVLRGLSDTIQRNRPLVWVEISETTLHTPTTAALAELIPVPFRLMMFRSRKVALFNRSELVEHTTEDLPVGDYVIIPEGYSTSPTSVSRSRQ